MTSELYQAIEQIGREKAIEADIIVAAVEEAYAAAARKYLHSHENLFAKFDKASSSLSVFARKTVVADVETEPAAGPDRRAGRQADHLSEGQGSRARERLQRVQRPDR